MGEYVPHNTFDVAQIGEGRWQATSHNFPEISVKANSKDKAIEALQRAAVYYSDNNPKLFEKRIKERIKKGLLCECGVRLKEPVMGIYKKPRKMDNFKASGGKVKNV